MSFPKKKEQAGEFKREWRQSPVVARPANEDRIFGYLLDGQKGIGRVFPYSTRAPE
jgi:hypothetical protein